MTQTNGQGGTVRGTKVVALTLLAAFVLVPTGFAGEEVEALDSQVCGDFKGENAGTGGDKYTQCNAHPDSGKVVNFVCASPSANAIEVVANDSDAEAKGKIGCDDTTVATCKGKVTCNGADKWDEGDTGTKVEGDCLGGTEEAFDSGMTWACVSAGVGLCDGPECDTDDAVDEAIEAAEDAVETVKNATESDVTALATLFESHPSLESLVVGVVTDEGEGVGYACEDGVCFLRAIECVTVESSRSCWVSSIQL